MISSPFPALEVNLSALQENYRLLNGKHSCAAVVKANGYGLGIEGVAPALYKAGCREFFVATLEEGVALRGVLDEQALIYVFHGVRAGQNRDFLHHQLIPVINNPYQHNLWQQSGKYALHIDTGMSRLGYASEAAKALAKDPSICLVMSHLACADEPEHPKNQEQLKAFSDIRSYFPDVKASLANSAGCFLGQDYYFDSLRPGCALYGIAPNTALRPVLRNVVNLSAPILQYTKLVRESEIGYGATVTLPKGSVIATVELGYCDGLVRLAGNALSGYAGDIRLPIAGRISMDMVMVDVTALPENLRNDQLRISFINNLQTVNMMADAAQTIGYEIFTKMGNRVKRVYRS